MTAVEAWCGVTGNDCYPTNTQLCWIAVVLFAVAAVGLVVAGRQIWKDRP